MKALLVIDMQQGSFRPYTLRHDTPGVIERINALAEAFRAQKYPVIFIQHDGSKEDCFLPGSTNWQLLPELNTDPTDYKISKTANDCFYKSELYNTLISLQVSTLYMSGCATDFCVDSTIKSAHSKDFEVMVIADGHTTANRPFASAQSIVDHYNWLWTEMTATKHKITVLKAAEVKFE